MPDITLPLNPNEPNPNFMMYQELARKLILKALMGNDGCFWIFGETGIGKTTFLLWLKEFSSLYKLVPIFFHAGEGIEFREFEKRIEEAIKPSFFPRIFLRRKVTKKPLLLLVDEIEYIKDKEIFSYMVSKLDDPDLHLAVVFSSIEPVEMVKKTFKGRDIEEISLEMPPKEIVMEMVRKRIEASGGNEFQPFGRGVVESVIEKSKTPREVLIKLEEIEEKEG